MEQAAKQGLVVNPEIKVSMNEAKDGLIIEIPFEKRPHPSRRGESFIVASTHGNLRTGVKFKREAEIILQVNAMVDLSNLM